jgi:hypothetical protein
MFKITNTGVSDLNSIIKDVLADRESIILKQLNELVSQGLLVVEKGSVSLYHDPISDSICCTQMIELTVKEKEYIERLEKENVLLTQQIKELKEIWRKDK